MKGIARGLPGGRLRPGWLVAAAVAGLAIALQTGSLAQGSGDSGASTGAVLGRDLAIVLVLIFINGMFSMAEAALLTVRRSRIEQLVEEGNRAARVVSHMLSEPTRMLSTIQVGITLVGLFSAGAAADSAVMPLAQFLRARFAGTFVATGASTIAFVVVMLTVSLLTLVIGEITPKSIAVVRSEAIALAVAFPIRTLQSVIGPVVTAVTALSNILVRPFGGTATFHTAALSEEELKIMVEQSEEYGVIEPQEKEMIHSIFDFADTTVRKVMTPRLDITAVEADVSVEELIRSVSESGHSRLPVYDDNLDNIVGVVHVKDVLERLAERGLQQSVREVMRPPYFIPDGKRIDDLLGEFRRNKRQLAIVRDEYGTVTGVVSLEDLLEEIVGEIQDEYDVEEPEVCQVDEQTCIIDARMSVEDFNDRMGVELPADESDTLGGFLFSLLGHQPEAHETAMWEGLEFGVEATDGRRIQKVRVARPPRPAHEVADGEEADAGSERDGSGNGGVDR
ncbi:MAG: HlyC/CorC family transporter [Chthonomonadales bacterium]|nr:HlyC/CorC family transporter [Chthonomonadales bacterium]